MSNTRLSEPVVFPCLAFLFGAILATVGCSPSSQTDDNRVDQPAKPPAVELPVGTQTPAVSDMPEVPKVPERLEVPEESVVEPLPRQPAEQPEKPVEQQDREPAVQPDRPETEPPETKPSSPQQEFDPALRPNPLRGGERVHVERPPMAKPAEAEASRPQPIDKHGRPPFDPIRDNGPVFVGWPKPKLAIVITGRQDGYLEPCGCAGLDRMKGGLSRRHSMFQTLRQAGWPILGIDVGGLCKGFGRQAELKFHTTVEAMRTMGYSAIGLGFSDLRFPAAELVSVAAGVNGKPGPFVSANVGLLGFAANITPQSRILNADGIKVGITSVLGTEFQRAINNPEIELADPEAALAKVLPDMKKESDLLILLAHATMKESIELAKRFPNFDLVVTAGGAPEPPAKPVPIEGTKALMIEVGEKGMDAIVIGLFDDSEQPLRYQRVPLDSRFPASREMRLLMTAYQDQLRELGFAGLGIRSVPHPRAEIQGKFVGSKKCQDCHEKSYKIWKKSGHAKAYQTLASQDPPRQFDPECISCHVIGWHPHHYFPYESGYLSVEKTPEMLEVGCESCHGPGEAHVKAEMGGDTALQAKLQKAMVITKEEARKQQCLECHDIDNSPDFNFETYWPHVEHYEDE